MSWKHVPRHVRSRQPLALASPMQVALDLVSIGPTFSPKGGFNVGDMDTRRRPKLSISSAQAHRSAKRGARKRCGRGSSGRCGDSAAQLDSRRRAVATVAGFCLHSSGSEPLPLIRSCFNFVHSGLVSLLFSQTVLW